MKMEVLGGKIRRNLISLNLRLRNNNSCFTLAPLGFKHCISSTSTLSELVPYLLLYYWETKFESVKHQQYDVSKTKLQDKWDDYVQIYTQSYCFYCTHMNSPSYAVVYRLMDYKWKCCSLTRLIGLQNRNIILIMRHTVIFKRELLYLLFLFIFKFVIN